MLNPYLTPPRREWPLWLRLILLALASWWFWKGYTHLTEVRAMDLVAVHRGAGNVLAEHRVMEALWAVVLTFYVVAISAAMGHAFLTRNFRGTLSPVLVFPVHLGLGLGFFSAVFLVLGAAKGGYAPWAVGLVLLAGSVNLFRWIRFRRTRQRPLFEDPPEKPLWWGVVIGLMLVAAVAALAPPTSHDDLVYHLENPAHMLEADRVDAEEWNAYSHLPNMLHFLYVPLLEFDPLAAGPRLLTVALGFVIAVMLYRIGCYWFMPRAGGMAGLLFLTSPVVLRSWSVASLDMAGTFFITAAILVMLVAPMSRAYAHARLAGVLAGCALACRLTAVSGILGLIVLLFGLWIHWRREARDLIGFRVVNLTRLILAFLWPLGLVLVPFGIRMWLETGNPIYPFGSGGPGMEETIREGVKAWHASMGMGHHLGDFVKLPWRLVARGVPGEYGRFDGVLQPWMLLLAPLVIGAPRHLLKVGLLGLMLTVGTALWFSTSQQERFLMPMLPWAALIGGLGFEVFVRGFHLSQRSTVSALLGSAIVLTGLFWAPPQDLLRFSENIQVVAMQDPTGADARQAYLRRNLEVYPALEWLDSHGQGGVVLLWENRVYHLDRPALADPVLEVPHTFLVTWAGKDPGQIAADLRAQGFTQILMRTDARDFTLGGGTWAAINAATHDAVWDPLVESHLDLVHREGPYEIYTIRAEPRSPEVSAGGPSL